MNLHHHVFFAPVSFEFKIFLCFFLFPWFQYDALESEYNTQLLSAGMLELSHFSTPLGCIY